MEKQRSADPARSGSACANCGTRLIGEYCHACGQRRIHHDLSLRAVAADAIAHTADVAELKTLRTLTTLLAKPGQLTNDYIAGRRANWITPLKLYLTIFGVTFFLYSAFKSVAVYDVGSLVLADRSGMWRKAITALAAKKHVAVDAFVADVNARWHSYATFSQVIYPLLFAVVLKIFYLGRKFVEHLIFSLHYQAVAFLITIFAWPLYYVTGLALTQRSIPVVVLVTAALVTYLVLSARAVYRQSWPTTITKGVIIYGAYYIIYTTVTFGTLLAAVMMTMRAH